jgi:hypothetical protein
VATLPLALHDREPAARCAGRSASPALWGSSGFRVSALDAARFKGALHHDSQRSLHALALIAAGGGLANVKVDPTLATAIVSVLDCNETPASDMLITAGAPGPSEKLVYLYDSLPSASATHTDTTGSAIIYNVTPGTLALTASFASDNRPLRSVSTLARVGWVTFVQIRLDQATRVPL